MSKIIDGKKIAQEIFAKLKRKAGILKKQGIALKLAVVLVGEDKASISFIKKKEEACHQIGIDFELFKFFQNIDTEELIEKINIIQNDDKLSAVVVQLPLPKKIDARNVLEIIKPELDVDCLTSFNQGKLTTGMPVILPPTAAACLHLLKKYKINLDGKHVVIVGRGDLVGKPLSIILTQDRNTITACNKYTKNLKNITLQADILITGTGVVNLIKGEMVKKGVIVIDAGTGFKGKKIFGDCEFKSVYEKAKLITPVPGGVGPVTVAKLLENVFDLYRLKDK
jgi:methylenetetrahydrofolate dehydrogenase (NADP+)/methenyltetrahydrofolate cyclohydrolase